ncbi:MAG TPA: hypothetical protein VGQ17_15570 [Gemmatimonadales bacterium]|jgi:hypothetical protein|nr:hypothetical protein [Gemmatimonadales bacterium]
MRNFVLAVIGAAAVAGCAQKPAQQVAADSASRSIQLPKPDSAVALNDVPAAAPQQPAASAGLSAPPARRSSASRVEAPPRPARSAVTPSPAPAPAPEPARAARLEPGTVVEATSSQLITSRTNKPGETFTARIAEAVTSSDGRVVIPAGAEVTLTIAELKPAPNKSAKDGTLVLNATSVTINGESHPIDAEVTSVEHTLKGRGVGGKEAAKVGIGAAGGLIIGKIIGGGTGAAVGGVTGAAAGAAVAVETADRDVVIPVGARIKLALRAAFIS